ncbi:hypothetical protein I8D64_09130 [Brachybacterium sp. MASK1Z-5]|uniref:Alkaline ceramidase n=1 Tax=Brachybacterium halotolerans TaxID=2795215 RepID=A0ABS1BA83_9MICO|nr:hypothetical protein [Brachybacterium halotolerans]MBK0331565.1 hypothetical protein [Brachybacterium halotolerans]
MIDVGAAVQPLGIPSPVPMSGFAARVAPSVGEHDVLGARALALGDAVIIAVDVCALEESTCRAIAEAVRPGQPDLVVVTATHTHAGPCSALHRLTPCTPTIERMIVRAAATAGLNARAARQPCMLALHSAWGVGVAKNRRHPGREIDPPVRMLRFSAGGSVVAALVTYPCHPVVLDGTNLLLSSDYINAVRRRIELEHPEAVAVFTTGCAGDVNTGHRAEASYSLEGAGTRTFAEAERVGTHIAETILATAPTPMDSDVLVLRTRSVMLEIDRPGDVQIEADLAAWSVERTTAEPGRAALLDVWIRWARDRPEGTVWQGRVTALRLGELTIVALPGEPFLDVAEAIEEQVEGPCLVLGYADGCPGYLPTAEEYQHGGYEVEDAHRYYGMPGPFASGSAESLVWEAVAACRAAV